MAGIAPVRFDNPPVIEVVFGVQFGLTKALRSPLMGIFWAQIKDRYPRTLDQAPIQPAVERFEEPASAPQLSVEFSPLPPLRRAWFLSTDGRRVVQVQEDRLLFNWKRATEADPYPGFEALELDFEREHAAFRKFVKDALLGEITYKQLDLTYVNHFPISKEMPLLSPTKVLVDHVRDVSRDRILPEPEALKWNTSYRLADGRTRLHIEAGTARRPQKPSLVMRVDLVARGLPTDTSPAGQKAWFAMAHDWITRGFVDATSTDAQVQVWKRTS